MIPFDFDDQDKPTSDADNDAEGRPVRLASGRRPGHAAREGAARVDSRDADDAEDDWDGDAAVSDARPVSASPGPGAGVAQEVHRYLTELSKDELVAFVERLAAQDSAIRKALADQVATARGPTADLLRRARITVDSISAEAIYEGNEPSHGELGRLRDRLDALVARGRADDVLMLCQRLLRHANRAVEAMEETDDGFFAAISHALEVVPEALARSSKSPVEQLIWLFEFELSEDYDLTPDMADFWDLERPAEIWNELAARIEEWLAANVPASPSVASTYGVRSARDAWTSLLADALRKAGRGEEIGPLYEREAELTGSYQRLVTYLLAEGDLGRAEHWIRRGIAATPEQLPGIVSQLRQGLHTIRERQGDVAGLAALDAYELFERPGLKTFQDLLASAEVAGVRDVVRRHALRFLETLTLPWRRSDVQQAASSSPGIPDDGSDAALADAVVDLPPWPLPPTGLPDPARPRYEQPPLARVLLDVALAEERLDDVLVWYDRLRAPRSGGAYYGYSDPGATVARAVERSHPDRAIAIWNDLAVGAIARTQTEAYREAARYLEQAGRIEERRGNLAAWRKRVLELQARERRKYRLREILDDLLRRFPPA